MILDEATSFADPEKERAIQKVLARLLDDRTVLGIAHRLRTVRTADAIVVLREDVKAEEGTH